MPTVWPPDAAIAQKSQLWHFMRSLGIADFNTFHAKSIDDPAAFLALALTFFRIKLEAPVDHVSLITGGINDSTWLQGGRLNAARLITENAPPSQIAITWENDLGESRSWSYRAFSSIAKRAAGALLAAGAGPGCRILSPPALSLEKIALLAAAARIGATVVSSSPTHIVPMDQWESFLALQATHEVVSVAPDHPFYDWRTHGAFLIKAALDLALTANVTRGTRFAWFGQDPAMLLGALTLGATVILFDDGGIPTTDRLWALCAHQNVEVLGITPNAASRLPPSAADRHNLDSLQTIVIDGVLDDATFGSLHFKTKVLPTPVLQYQNGILSDNLLLAVEPGRPAHCCPLSLQ